MPKKKPNDYQELIKQSGVSLEKLSSPSKKIQKSVRTTFNLEKEVYKSMLLLCKNYGMKQKELIDEVVAPNALTFVNEFIDPISREKLSKDENKEKMVDLERRTFVLSKESLKKLNDLSKSTGIHRDRLFKFGVLLQKAALDDFHKKHRKAAELIRHLSEKNEEIGTMLASYLDEDDPITSRVAMIGVIIDNLLMAIEAELSTGTPIDYDDISQSG